MRNNQVIKMIICCTLVVLATGWWFSWSLTAPVNPLVNDPSREVETSESSETKPDLDPARRAMEALEEALEALEVPVSQSVYSLHELTYLADYQALIEEGLAEDYYRQKETQQASWLKALNQVMTGYQEAWPESELMAALLKVHQGIVDILPYLCYTFKVV